MGVEKAPEPHECVIFSANRFVPSRVTRMLCSCHCQVPVLRPKSAHPDNVIPWISVLDLVKNSLPDLQSISPRSAQWKYDRQIIPANLSICQPSAGPYRLTNPYSTPPHFCCNRIEQKELSRKNPVSTYRNKGLEAKPQDRTPSVRGRIYPEMIKTAGQ